VSLILKRSHFLISALLVFVLLYGCGPGFSPATPTPTLLPTATLTTLPTSTSTATPTLVPTATIIPSPTPVPVYLPATVWTSDPQVPILVYHRFYPDRYETSTSTKIRLSDFESALQSLYDSGYTLVPLANWLKGDMRVPEGRKPLIITLDDLFFADQIFLNEDGTPSPKSGIGLLWQFSQDHPDFGFSASLFYNMGDKHYGSVEVEDWWQEGPGWEESLAKAITWCIENGVLPYNHFYTHPKLSLITNVNDFNYQAKENEISLRDFLSRIGEESLADNLDNLIAIPYGDWPTTPSVLDALRTYVSTDGKALLGIMNIDYSIRAKYLQPVYSPDFDRLDIPRIVGNQDAIDLLVAQKDNLPAAQSCSLGPLDTTRVVDQEYLIELITQAGSAASCPDGIYSLEQGLFRLENGSVTPISFQLP
jgi:hypothetical protein